MTLSGPSSDAAAPPRPVRVLIVDDSAIIRALIERILKTDPHITVCGFARNGQETLEALNACDPDIVVLDIGNARDGRDHSPCPAFWRKKPKVKVLICSTLSDRARQSLSRPWAWARRTASSASSPTAISATGEFRPRPPAPRAAYRRSSHRRRARAGRPAPSVPGTNTSSRRTALTPHARSATHPRTAPHAYQSQEAKGPGHRVLHRRARSAGPDPTNA